MAYLSLGAGTLRTEPAVTNIATNQECIVHADNARKRSGEKATVGFFLRLPGQAEERQVEGKGTKGGEKVLEKGGGVKAKRPPAAGGIFQRWGGAHGRARGFWRFLSMGGEDGRRRNLNPGIHH